MSILNMANNTTLSSSTGILAFRRALLSLCLVFLTGCSTVSYYSQAVGGHLKLMTARQSIEKLLADADTDEELKTKLQTLKQARQFAVEKLLLPENDSYSTYVETGRRAVTWNVVATEEFSMRPVIWCFPVAGCVSYRGYFDHKDAETFAAGLAEQSHDVTIGGAAAYSTLGWFDDPVLDTMLRGGDIRFVGTLFHELAHQVLYVKDDSNFNEAFASFVEQAGVRQWLTDEQQSERILDYDLSLSRALQFGDLLKNTRQGLITLYKQDMPQDLMREEKAKVFEAMLEDYEALKVSWDGYNGYDGWFRRGLNNAQLVAVATYRQYVPAFASMYEEVGQDWAKFYSLAKEIAELPVSERKARVAKYLESPDQQS